MPFGTHARVGQNLRDGVFGRRTFFAFVGTGKMLDVVGGVIKTDELYGVCDRLYQVTFFDKGGHDACYRKKGTAKQSRRFIDGAGTYLPRHTGLRFSAKAVAPSLASAEVKICATRGRCRSNMSAWRQSRDSVTIFLAICTASGPFSA